MAEVWAADISQQALSLTLHNAELNHVTIHPLQLDILTPRAPVPSCPYSLIVSNPPYIPSSERSSMALHVAGQEPDLALFVPNEDPLVFYRAIAEFARENLCRGGELYVEIHDRFGKEVSTLFGNHFSHIELKQDIHGKDRMVRAYNG
jgi:release factor glutamine methyltransferase